MKYIRLWFVIRFVILVLISSSAMAATITFESPKPNQFNNLPTEKITTPFMVESVNHAVKGLENPAVANGTFNMLKNAQGIPRGDIILITNSSGGVYQVPLGLIDYNVEGDSGDYHQFRISAGVNPGKREPLQDYCITPYLNDRPIPMEGVTDINGNLKNTIVCTTHGKYKEFTVLDEKIDLSGDSNIKFVITYH